VFLSSATSSSRGGWHRERAAPGAVHIQVVPYGKMEAIARSEYGDLMVDMELPSLSLPRIQRGRRGEHAAGNAPIFFYRKFKKERK
jgi:hypothetical protein